MSFPLALTFDDVCLVPQYNNIDTRLEPNLGSWLTNSYKMGSPILASNMDTVICDELADILITNGSRPIFHRFCSFEQQSAWVKKYGNKCFISCGYRGVDNALKLLEMGAAGVCIDIAHGHSQKMIETVKAIRAVFPQTGNWRDKQIIAGNVCTVNGYTDLYHAGADAVKVGIGPGCRCTTRTTTGFGVPQFSAIYEIAQQAKKLKIPVIADGGIRNGRDVALALAAGATTVMIGGLFAKTVESAAPTRADPFDANKTYKNYRGQASKEFQEEYYGTVKKGTVPEGEAMWTLCDKTAQELMDYLHGSLRSAMTYGSARTIGEFQDKAEFRQVTPAYMAESSVRKEVG